MKARIIDASLSLFRKYGIKGVTMDDLAEELSMSKRTLYQNFTNKEELMVACIEQRFQQEELFQIDDKELLDNLLHCYKTIELILQQVDRRCCMGIRKYHPKSYETIHNHFASYAAMCRDKVAEGIDSGYIRSDISADFVYNSIMGYLKNLFSSDEYDRENSKYEVMSYSILVFARGISTIKGRAYIDNKLRKSRHEIG